MSNRYEEYMVLQHDQKDCGCACLKMALRYYGGEVNLEYLKEISGTSSRGTSFLGLIQAAKKIGINALSYEASMDDLKDIQSPFILHVEREGFLHYIICFNYNKNKGFTIIDPAIGSKIYSEYELKEIWRSGYLLILNKDSSLKIPKGKSINHFSWVLEMIRADTSYYISAVFLGIIIALLSMSTLVFTEKLVDVVLPSRNITLLYKTLSLWMVLLLFAIGLTYLRSLILIKQAYNFNIRVFDYFFKRLLKMPKVFFDSKSQGDMIARLNDTERLQSNIKSIIADSLIEVLVIFFSFLFLFSYSKVVAFIVLFSLPVLYLCAWLFNEFIKEYQNKMFLNYALTKSNYIDTISGIETIKVFGKETSYSKMNLKNYMLFQQAVYKLLKQSITQSAVISIGSTIIAVFGISYAVFQTFTNKIQLGDLIAIMSLVFMIIDAIKEVVQLNFEIFESKIAIERMFDFVQRSEEIITKKESKTAKLPKEINCLSINKISFHYPGQDFLIRNASLKLQRGKISYLTGQSGSGKSSLAQLILNFYEPNAGSIIINKEINLSAIAKCSWRNNIAYVPQNIKIFNDSLLYNISLDHNISSNTVIKFCEESLNFSDMFLSFKNSYATILGEEGVTPSGGEKQLIAIARALFSKPKVLILDEATASMDQMNQDRIIELLNGMKKKMIILFITHDQDISSKYNDNKYIFSNKEISLIETKHC